MADFFFKTKKVKVVLQRLPSLYWLRFIQFLKSTKLHLRNCWEALVPTDLSIVVLRSRNICPICREYLLLHENSNTKSTSATRLIVVVDGARICIRILAGFSSILRMCCKFNLRMCCSCC
ncbi:uncharacterized protein [Spinacia oleracea]|uniref:Uncharacterized protein n=1 Tax=Spinacia oleracea TaxID=3562 RepID=A0ABM3QWP9_SPIOL|nr:uncharacterized protein LOC110801816 [Spinacia oleracea]